ncbi:MAG: DUF4434 domain-containing protein [Candidatus Hydrogenedentes bacterium]|nr:DUF4434 domain-containing protein [Candidatus Hydrogenedentota bacterium]
MPTKRLIRWSGELSQKLGGALRPWLPGTPPSKRGVHRIQSRLLVLGLAVLLGVAAATQTSAKTPALKPITGAFVQLDGTNLTWTHQQWQQELESMRKLGMDTLIIDGVALNEYAFCRIDSYPIWPNCGTEDPLKTLLSISEQLDIQVWVGLYRQGWEDQTPPAFEEFARRCKTVADEFWDRYGKAAPLAGWYLLNWEIGNTAPLDNIGVKAYLDVVPYLRNLTPNLSILISPYFTLDITPAALEEGWRTMLPAIKPDIVALQDGVGCDRKLTPDDTGPYFQALARACKDSRVRFWGNVETFDQPAGWKTATPDRVLRQIETVSPHCEKVITWEYSHYLSPLTAREGWKDLYDALAKLAREEAGPHP